MSLASYGDLQTAVANWLNKSNLAAYIPDFIALAEADINRELRIRNMEAIGTGTFSSQTLDLSSVLTRYAKVKSVTLSSGGAYWVQNYISPQQYYGLHYDSQTGIPRDYTIIGDDMYFGPSPDDSYTWTIWYYQKLDSLATTATNTVLTNHPDVYLYGSLVAAEPFLKNDARVALWKTLYGQALEGVKRESRNDRPGGTSKQTSEMGTP